MLYCIITRHGSKVSENNSSRFMLHTLVNIVNQPKSTGTGYELAYLSTNLLLPITKREVVSIWFQFDLNKAQFVLIYYLTINYARTLLHLSLAFICLV